MYKRADKYIPQSVVCGDCGLPSYPGLPPFVKVTRQGNKVLVHDLCPGQSAEDTDEIIAAISEHVEALEERMQERRKQKFGASRKWSTR